MVIAFLALVICSCGVRPSLSAKVDGTQLEASGAGAEYHKGRLHILGGFGPTMSTIINIYVNASSSGVYPLNSEEYGVGNYAGYSLSDKRNETLFVSNSQYTGTMEITDFDSVGRRVSGTFEFDVIQMFPYQHKFGTRSVHITAGKFNNVPIQDTLQLNQTE